MNWKFLSNLKEEIQTDSTDPQLLDLGSCSLHVVHGALQTGHGAAKWNGNSFLRGSSICLKIVQHDEETTLHPLGRPHFP